MAGLISTLLRDSKAGCALLTVLIVSVGLVLGLAGVESARWGSQWGTKTAKGESAWFRAGVAGFLAGSIFFPLLGILIMLAVISKQQNRQSDPVSATALYACIFVLAGLGALVSARFRMAGRALLSLISGFALGANLAVSLHMTSLLPKTVTLIIILLLSLVFGVIVSLPQLSPSMSSKVLCAGTATLGAYLLACAISLWQPTGYLDAVSLFVAEQGVFSIREARDPDVAVVDWRASRVKGLTAGVWLLSIAFAVFQLWRYRQIGESPHDIWNQVLGNYLSAENAANVSMNGRQGVFVPALPWYKRIFQTRPANPPPYWPEDDDVDEFDPDEKPSRKDLEAGAPGLVRYDSYPASLHKYDVVSRRSLEDAKRPPLSAYTSVESGLSGKTLVDPSPSQPAKYNVAATRSFSEPQAGTLRARMKSLFGKDVEPVKAPRRSLSIGSRRSVSMDVPLVEPAKEKAPVQATPSLIKAIERISEAQKQATAWQARQTIEEVQEADADVDEHQRIEQEAEEEFLNRIRQGL